jgi:hypothetical protein
MKALKNLLLHSAQMLMDDVKSYRKIILDSGSGQLPPEIKKKEKLAQEIEMLLKTSTRNKSFVS